MRKSFKSLFILISLIFVMVGGLKSFGNEKVYVTAFSKSETIGNEICFSESDFSNSVYGNDKIAEIKIFELPTSGKLKLNDLELKQGEYINVSDLNNLKYCYDKAEKIEDRFGIIPVFYKSGTSDDLVYISLYLSDKENFTPVAVNSDYKTYSGVQIKGKLNVIDFDDDNCVYKIIKSPKKGYVSIVGDSFVYVPKEGKHGKDYFEYKVTDSYGNTSNTAKITIEILKRSSKDSFSYCDMIDSEAHFEALYLREKGIMVGETFGEENFFYPEAFITRAQFVALVASVSDIAIPSVSVGTGLSDNEDIPVWARDYIAAAINCGVINGENDEEGNKVFRANDYITRAEAAAILDRALELADDNRKLNCSDVDSVPTWAEQSLINTTSSSLISLYDDNTIKANQNVTREDAAKMLYQSIIYSDNKNETQSFWGKLFK